MNLITNLVGYLGAVFGSLLMLPQVIKSYKTKQVEHVSFLMVIMYVANSITWIVYGLLLNAIPVVLTNSIAFVISIMQLVLRIRHRTRV